MLFETDRDYTRRCIYSLSLYCIKSIHTIVRYDDVANEPTKKDSGYTMLVELVQNLQFGKCLTFATCRDPRCWVLKLNLSIRNNLMCRLDAHAQQLKKAGAD